MSDTMKELRQQFERDLENDTFLSIKPHGIEHNEAYDNIMSMVLKPKQYQIGIDTFQRAKANLTKEEYLACLKFNIDKYCWREKGQDKEDFEKIIAYAKEAISVLDNHV